MRRGGAARARGFKSYPEGVAWDAQFRPTLVGALLDQAVQAFGRALAPISWESG